MCVCARKSDFIHRPEETPQAGGIQGKWGTGGLTCLTIPLRKMGWGAGVGGAATAPAGAAAATMAGVLMVVEAARVVCRRARERKGRVDGDDEGWRRQST